MVFKVYGVASYSSDIGLLREYYSDDYIDLLLKPNGDMLINVIDCNSLDDAKEVLLLESKRWLSNLLPKGFDFNTLVSLSNDSSIKDLNLNNTYFIEEFMLSDRECKMSVDVGDKHTMRFEVVEATYTLFEKI